MGIVSDYLNIKRHLFATRVFPTCYPNCNHYLSLHVSPTVGAGGPGEWSDYFITESHMVTLASISPPVQLILNIEFPNLTLPIPSTIYHLIRDEKLFSK